MTTNNWNYVRVEDYEDNGNFRDWAITETHVDIHMILHGLRMQYNVSIIQPQIRLREAIEDIVYWVEYTSTYDEIETTETIGFIYDTRVTNDDILDAFTSPLRMPY